MYLPTCISLWDDKSSCNLLSCVYFSGRIHLEAIQVFIKLIFSFLEEVENIFSILRHYVLPSDTL